MLQWGDSGTEWTTGLQPAQESDFIATQDTCINEYTGIIEHKYKLLNKPTKTIDNHVDKVIILTFQAYCRYKALLKRLEAGMTIAKSRLTALGGVMVTSKSTRILFCQECFSCPELEKFHLSRDNKAPVLKGRPRKKRIRNSTLAKELKRKRFLADLERVKTNLLHKKPKLSESEEGTESDLSEESTKSSESMDEADQPRIKIETPISRVKPPNGVCPVSIKQVVMVMNDKTKAPPPLIPTTRLKGVVTSPPPLHKVKIKTEVPMVTKLDSGPPPLCPITKKTDVSNKVTTSLQSRVPECSRSSHDAALPLSTSKTYSAIKTVSYSESSSGVTSIVSSKTDCFKANEPLGSVDSRVVTEGRPVGIVKVEGKENLQDSKKEKKKRRLRQPGSMKEFNEDVVDDDEKYFMRSLRDFMKSRDTPISKIPALGFKRVNLWTMYKTAQNLGGYEMVTTKRLWRQVYDALGGSTTITSAATYTRRHYERLLLPYERFVRQINAKKGGLTQVPKSIQDTTAGRDLPIQPKNTGSPSTLKTNPTANNDKVSRIVVSSIGGSQTKELRDNKDIPGVTSSLSRNGLKSNMVKVKPNGALPPYSVSIQSTRKEGVTPSTIIVTKSVDVPVSPNQSLPSSTQRNSTTSISKSVTPVTTHVTQKRNTVTPNRTSVTPFSSHAVSVNNAPRSISNATQPLWKKDYVTTSAHKQNIVTEKQNVVMQKQNVVTQIQNVVTQKQHVTHKQNVITQKQNVVTQKQNVVTQKENVVTQSQSTKELVLPKEIPQTNGRELQSPPAHKSTYTVNPEEQIKTRSRRQSESESNQEKRNDTQTKYLTISETYDLLHSKSRKRSIEDNDTSSNIDKEPLYMQDNVVEPSVRKQEYVTTINAAEPSVRKQEYVTRISSAEPSVRKQEYVTRNNAVEPSIRKQEYVNRINSAEPSVRKQEYVTRNNAMEPSVRKQEYVTRIKSAEPSVRKQEYVTRNNAMEPSVRKQEYVTRNNAVEPSVHKQEYVTRNNAVEPSVRKQEYVTRNNAVEPSVRKQEYVTRCNVVEPSIRKQEYVVAEPAAKRRKTSSPLHAIPQHHFVSHADMSRNTSNTEILSRNADTNMSTHVTCSVHSVNTSRGHEISKDPVVHTERENSDILDHPKQHMIKSHPKDVVDLTDIDSSSSPILYHRTSPLYTKMSYSYNNNERLTEPSARTHPRVDNSRHVMVTHSKVPRDYRDETPQQNGHATTSITNEHAHFKSDKQIEFERHIANSEIQRTLSQRASVETPDAHFQEWRRRQGLTQYPAYITNNEPRRRQSITEHLHPQTPPLEHRYVYVQDENGLTPRVIEEVPLIISPKPGLYYPEDSFYSAIPFYHGGWPATGVADGLQFKGDPETLRNNNHLRGTSCVFMPTSQMFGSAAPIAPISPPMINHDHVTSGPEGVHQHCIMTSPYSHNHVIVSQTQTRPLHSFT